MRHFTTIRGMLESPCFPAGTRFIDITVTAGSVDPDDDAVTRVVTAGATITAGQPVYLDPSDSNKAKTAVTTNATTANCAGIALHGASNGQDLRIITGGTVNIGATVAVGEVYVLSDNAGGIAPDADNGAGDYVTILGIGTTTAKIKVNILVSGVAHA